MTQKMKRWGVALGYVGFIYATLGLARTATNFLRSHGWLKLSLGGLHVFCFALIVGILIKNSPRSIWRYAALFIIMGLYSWVAQQTSSPEEQIHFLEYGLVGVFFLRAVALHTKSKARSFVSALLLAGLSGWFDEILQGYLPNRHFDVRDILLNIISASLGLVVFSILPLKSK